MFDMTETKGVTVRSGLIEQLTNFRYKDEYGTAYTSIAEQSEGNEKDYFELFKYISDNAKKNEFSLQFFRHRGKNWIELGTYHQYNVSPQPDQDKAVITKSYHNHSDTKDNIYIEFGQIGANPDGSFLDRHDYSDFYQTLTSEKPPYTKYVYYTNSSRLYSVTQYGVKFVKYVCNPNEF